MRIIHAQHLNDYVRKMTIKYQGKCASQLIFLAVVINKNGKIIIFNVFRI